MMFIYRLSEDENITVGVIEAGAYDPDVAEINVPGMLLFAMVFSLQVIITED